MGRKENPLDPNAGPLPSFAFALRKLRQEAGGLTYRALAARAGYSVPTLSQAAAGEKLPTLAVTLAYVRACGGDTAEWERRWHELAHEPAPDTVEDDGAPPPYLGLARFDVADHERYFGRAQLTEDLLRLVREHRFTTVFGPSGSGKSSLLRAGLAAALHSGTAQLPRPAALRLFTPGDRPARSHRELFTPAGSPGDTWLLVDQFEEIFTLCHDRRERAEFIGLLLHARDTDSGLRVVLGVRADFYGRCLEHRGLTAALREASLPVGPMSTQELREAVVRPAAAQSLIVERALTARLVAETADAPGGLPLLSHALLETWRRRRGRALTEEAYEAAGGVHGAVAKTAERVFARLSPEQQETARRILLRLITPGEGTQDTRRSVVRAELASGAGPDTALVLEQLVRARLLTVDDTTVDLAHEALITAWPRLHGWIQEDRGRLRLHRRLTEAARGWDELARDAGALYRGARLTAAREAAFAPEELTPLEREFLAASQAHGTRERRRMRLLVGGLSLLVVLALVAGAVVWQQGRTNERRRVETAARRVAAVADNNRYADPRTALRLSIAAHGVAETTETRAALMAATTQREQDAFRVPVTSSTDAPARLSADGRTAVDFGDREVWLWDTVARRRRSGGPAAGSGMAPAVLSPDARRLALARPKGGVRVREVASGAEATLPKALATPERFSPSGRTLVVGSTGSGASVQLWDVGRRRLLFAPEARGVEGVAVSPDDRLLALCRAQRIEVWDVAAKRLLTKGGLPRADCDRDSFDHHGVLAFVPGPRPVLAVLEQGAIRRWDVTAGRELGRIDFPGLTRMAFSEDGAYVAAAGTHEILLWRTSDPDEPVYRYGVAGDDIVELRLDTEQRRIRYSLLMPQGEVATMVRTLDVGGAVGPGWQHGSADGPAWQRGAVAAARFSPDGTVLATTRAEGGPGAKTFRLLDGHTGRRLTALRRLPCPDENCQELLGLSADGRIVVHGLAGPDEPGRAQRLYVYDGRTGRSSSLDLPRPKEAVGSLNAIALSPDGHTLAVAWETAAGPVELWDLRRRARLRTVRGVGWVTLALRPDGGLLAGSGDRVAQLPSGRTTRRESAPVAVTALAFSPDGRYLAVGENGGRVTVWDGAARRRLGSLSGTFTKEQQDAATTVAALAFSRDGRTLAVAGGQGTLQLWDVATNQRLGGAFKTPGDSVLALSFGADGATLYAAGDHVPLRAYALDAHRVTAAVCERAGGGLSRAQWAAYIPEVPYRQTC